MTKLVMKFFKKHWFIIILTLIGAFFRLYRLEATIQFLGDQGRDVLVMRHLIIDYDIPFLGPITSVGGFYLGPLYYYLMTPFLWLFNFNPVGPAYANAFIGIITLPILYFVTKKMFSQSAAKLTTFLYAFAAIPIQETRFTWNPNPMPLATLGIVFGFYQALKTNKSKWLLLSSLSLAIALQLHYMIVFLGPFILWQIFIFFKNKKLKKWLLPWFGIIILFMVPLILFEIKNNFLNIKGLLYFFQHNEYQKFDLYQNFRNLKGRSEEVIGMILGFGRNTNLARTTVTRLVLLATVILLIKKRSKSLILVSVWLLSSIATLAFYRSNIYSHYLGFLFPAVFILIGQTLSYFKGKLAILNIIFLLWFASFNLSLIKQTLQMNGNLKSVEKTARFIKQDIDKYNYQNYNLTLLDGTRDYKAMSFRYFLELYNGKPLGVDKYPQTNILYVISPYKQENDVADNPIWEINSLQPTELIDVWEFDDSENIYKIKRKGSLN